MRQLITAVLLLIGGLTPCVSGEAGETLRLRVLSYNIHHGEGVDGKLDLERIADVIVSVAPDVVALQEVDRNVNRTGKVDQAAELARLTEMNVVFGPNIDLQGGQYGNAVLSRWPIARHENHLLPNIDGGEQRGMLDTQIKVPHVEETVRLLATHLDHRSDERERVASAKVINDLIGREPTRPDLLAGDLNATPESATLRLLANMWTQANRLPLATVPVNAPTRQIDFILYRPANRWKVLEVTVLDEGIASDHRAILAVLELQPSPE